jgi:hypothetical protein
MGASAVIGLLATFGSMVGPKRNPKTAYAGACLAIVGGLIGAAISVTGALVSALGVALGFAGTVVISVSALVAAARSVRCDQGKTAGGKNRQIRSPKRAS